MINDDLNRFLKTFFYPILNLELIYDEDFEKFYEYSSEIEEMKLQKLDLDKSIFKYRKGCRDSIRKKSLKYLRQKNNISSYDMIYQYLEKWYLSDEKIEKNFKDVNNKNSQGQKNIELFDVVFENLRLLSKCLISKLDDKIIYKYWENENDKEILCGFSGKNKIHLYRALNQIIPTDLLVVLFVFKSENKEKVLKNFFGDIAVTDLALEAILQKGVAENHLHLGVTLNFSLVWNELVRKEIKKGESKEDFFKEFEHTYSENEMYFYFCLCRMIRRALIYIMSFTDTRKFNEKFSEFKIEKYFCKSNYKKLKKYLFYNIEEKEIAGEIESHFLEIQETFDNNFFIDNINTDKPKSYAMEDRLYEENLNLKDKETLQENKFLFLILKNIYCNKKDEKIRVFIKKLFLDYLRLKNYFFSIFVQNKNVFGLQHFQTYYKQTSSMNKAYNNRVKQEKEDLEHKILENSLQSLLSIKNIEKVEIRTSFFKEEKKLREYIKYFLESYKKFIYKNCMDQEGKKIIRKFPKVGLVLHFRKEEETDQIHCANLDEVDYLQYGRMYKKYKNELEVFKNIRDPEKFPGIDKYLLGIDVCSDENTMPTWVFKDLFENARDSIKEPLYNENNLSFQSLSFTCHTGEDFRHLISGIRAIYEVVTYFKFHTGDRIGHGLALGVDPYYWYKNNETVLLPRIEALENYIWSYKILSIYSDNQNYLNSQYLIQRINELSKEIFDDYIPVEIWVDAYDYLFSLSFEEILEKYKKKCGKCQEYNNYNDKDCKNIKDQCYILKNERGYNITYRKEDIINIYHCGLHNMKMREPIHYKIPEQELKIIIEVQKILKHIISDKGIVIEANPNSNITIADIDILEQHPLYNISSIKGEAGSILTCINSDNPGIFNTNVVNEIGFIYFTMIEKGIGREACEQCIDRLRGTGMRYSFIRREETDEYILQELEDLIDKL